MPKCAWLLIGSLFLILHHTIGTAETVGFLLSAALWALNTTAVLVAIASLAGWHLLNYHAPRPARARH